MFIYIVTKNCIKSKFGISCIYSELLKTNYIKTNHLHYQNQFINNNLLVYFQGYIIIKFALIISQDIIEKLPEIKNITF